jgi:SAM-dependent methyltransferase
VCERCRSIPRERAAAVVLEERCPDWRDRDIHESSPIGRGLSLKIRQQATSYVASQYFRGQQHGVVISGARNENLERQTFADRSFDIVIALDVLEHVNLPDAVCREVWRTLRPDGLFLFTAPTYKQLVTSERRAVYTDTSVLHLAEPDYHGNPLSAEGSLVTFHYGYDLAELVAASAPFDVTVVRAVDRTRAILGDMTEVYACRVRS